VRRTLLDTNVILEILLNRRLASQCLKLLEDTSCQYGISVLTVHIVWYIAEKYKLDQSKVDDSLSAWEILPMTAQTIKKAQQRYSGEDFEDCIQAVCAEEAEYSSILTIDKNFRQRSATLLSVSLIS
jgi:predicted nucleic-acid-binding protein